MFTLVSWDNFSIYRESGSLKGFFTKIMDAEWRREKLEVLLEKVDRGRVNSLGCDFFDNSLATNCRRRGNNQGPKYGRVKITLPDNTRDFFHGTKIYVHVAHKRVTYSA